MSSATLAQPRNKIFGTKIWALTTGVLLLAGIAAGVFTRFYAASRPDLPPVVTLAEFEVISGISPKMIVVTAAGGIVDLRFKVVNAEKANQLMVDATRFPRLLVEDSGLVLNSGAHHVRTHKEGATYFLFFPNTNSTVKTGTPLYVVVGQQRFGPIIAK